MEETNPNPDLNPDPNQHPQTPKKSAKLLIILGLIVVIVTVIIVIGIKGEYFRGFMLKFETPKIENTTPELNTTLNAEDKKPSTNLVYDKEDLESLMPTITIVDEFDGEQIYGDFERAPISDEVLLAFEVKAGDIYDRNTDIDPNFTLKEIQYEATGCYVEHPNRTTVDPPMIVLMYESNEGTVEPTSIGGSFLSSEWGHGPFWEDMQDEQFEFTPGSSTVFAIIGSTYHRCDYNKAEFAFNIKNYTYTDMYGVDHTVNITNDKGIDTTKRFLYDHTKI